MAAMALQSCVSLKLPSNFIFSAAFPAVINPKPNVLQCLGRGISSLSCVVSVVEWWQIFFRVSGVSHGNVDKD
jgi:hypothetical protein